MITLPDCLPHHICDWSDTPQQDWWASSEGAWVLGIALFLLTALLAWGLWLRSQNSVERHRENLVHAQRLAQIQTNEAHTRAKVFNQDDTQEMPTPTTPIQ